MHSAEKRESGSLQWQIDYKTCQWILDPPKPFSLRMSHMHMLLPQPPSLLLLSALKSLFFPLLLLPFSPFFSLSQLFVSKLPVLESYPLKLFCVCVSDEATSDAEEQMREKERKERRQRALQNSAMSSFCCRRCCYFCKSLLLLLCSFFISTTHTLI